jgi:CubicO group peptidase (beta-lactamase class C family)
MLQWTGETTESVIAPVADLTGSSDMAWGWAVLLLGAGWRVLTWPWLVSGARRRIDRLRGEGPPAASGWFGLVGTVLVVVQVLLLVVIALWTRTGPTADEAVFYGLDRLSSSPVTLGPGGLAWAAALALLGASAGLLGQRAAGVQDARQRFGARYISPVIFLCLGLFLPAAMVVPFTVSMGLNLAAVLWAVRETAVRTEVAV